MPPRVKKTSLLCNILLNVFFDLLLPSIVSFISFFLDICQSALAVSKLCLPDIYFVIFYLASYFEKWRFSVHTMEVNSVAWLSTFFKFFCVLLKKDMRMNK